MLYKIDNIKSISPLAIHFVPFALLCLIQQRRLNLSFDWKRRSRQQSEALKMHRENLWANTPFSFHLEGVVQDTGTKTHSFELPNLDQSPLHDALAPPGRKCIKKEGLRLDSMS